MSRFGTTLALLSSGALVLASLLSCNRSREENFDRSSEPLKLFPAPGALCSGEGTQKDCASPEGCQPRGTGNSDVVAGGVPAQSGAAPDALFEDSPNAVPVGQSIDDHMEPNAVMEAPTTGEVLDPLPPLAAPGDAGRPADAGPVMSDAGPWMTPLDAGAAVARDAGVALPEEADGGAVAPVDASSPAFSQLKAPLESRCVGSDSSHTETLFLSADDSNSMASPVIARRLIRRGQRVPPAIIRPYEFLNYYDFSFEPADPSEVRIVPQLSSCPMGGELNLQIALQAERRVAGDRRPLNLTLVLDTSGSMEGMPMALLKAAVRAMASRLERGDVVSMVTWDVDQRVRLSGYEVSGANDVAVLAAADGLLASGGTDLSGGLHAGYALAEMHQRDDRINRVVAISDGQANVGITDEQLIGAHASDEEGREGIYLAGIGVGDGVNDTLMDTVTDAGRGAYVYLDSVAEANRMLGERFLEVVDVAARSVRLELTLPWYMRVSKFYGEAISTDRTLVRPQHLGPNAAMVFFQVLEACDADLIHGDDRLRIRATWTTPFTRHAKAGVIESSFNDLAGEDEAIEKAAVVVSYAEALQRAGTSGTNGADAHDALQQALSVVREAPLAASDPDLLEIAELLDAYLLQFPAPL